MHTVLIVEDDIALLEVYREKFEAEGMAVHVAEEKDDGFLIACAVHPDIILINIEKPNIDGTTMLYMIRETDWGKKTPVMLLTSSSSKQDIASHKKDQVDRFVTTLPSLLPNNVVAVVKDFLSRKEVGP